VAFITSYDHSVPCKPGAELIAAILVPTGDSLEDAKACRADSRVAPYATVWPLHTADGQLLCLVYLAQ
jgi:hypothetical protein